MNKPLGWPKVVAPPLAAGESVLIGDGPRGVGRTDYAVRVHGARGVVRTGTNRVGDRAMTGGCGWTARCSWVREGRGRWGGWPAGAWVGQPRHLERGLTGVLYTLVELARGKGRVNGLCAALELDQALALVRVGRAVPTTQQLADLDHMLRELYVAQHETGSLRPGEHVQLGGDVRSAGRSFDVRTTNAAGQVQRAIEVKTIEAPVSAAAALDPGVAHAAAKVSGLPQGAVAEAAIHVEFAAQTAMGPNLRLIDPDGTWRIVSAADHSVEHRTGDMIDDFMNTRLTRGSPRPVSPSWIG